MKIIRDASNDPVPTPKPRETGIRRSNQGHWAAVRAGRLVEAFSGPGAKQKAIKAAGTNRVIA